MNLGQFKKGNIPWSAGRRETLSSRLERYSIPEPNSGCYLWLGKLDRDGYGHVYVHDGSQKGKMRRAAMVAYELAKGAIPPSLVIDHLCRCHACINPEHLEAVTQQENNRRGIASVLNKARNAQRTHCKNGHELTPENTQLLEEDGYIRRKCRICKHESDKRCGTSTASNARRKARKNERCKTQAKGCQG